MTTQSKHAGAGKLRGKATVYAGLGPDGRQRQRSRVVYADNARALAKAVEAARVELRAEIAAGEQWTGTVRELAGEWMAAKSRTHADSTRYTNRFMCERIVRELGRIPVAKLTAKDLDQFYRRLLDDGRTESTAHHYHRVIHGMLRQAHKWGQVPGNVADLATPPRKQGAHTSTVPAPADLRALLAAAPYSVRIAATIAAATGCRRGEIVGLRWSDIDGNVLHVRRSLVDVPGEGARSKAPKSGKSRTLVLDDDTLGMLLDHRMRCAGECAKAGRVLVADGPIVPMLSPSRSGAADLTGSTPYMPGWITKQWIALCKSHGVVCRFHDIRHFHASHLIDQGIPVTTVSERLGHAQVSTTLNIYSQAITRSDSDAADAIRDVMRGTGAP